MISASLRSLISTPVTSPTETPATRTSSPFFSRLALLNTAWYSLWLPKPKEPMIAARVPVTSSETSTNTPSLIAATVVAVLREIIRGPRGGVSAASDFVG